MNRGPSLPRRGVLKAGARIAALAAVRVTVGDVHAAEREALRRFEQFRPVDPKRRLLLKGGTIISLDAKVGDLVVTPRRGKAVEINALWYNALRLMEEWMNERGVGILPRPFDLDDLFQAVDGALDRDFPRLVPHETDA